MSTTAERLALLLNTKAAIKAALVEKGQEVDDIFSSYPDRIRAISTKVVASDDGNGNVTLSMAVKSTTDCLYSTILLADNSTNITYSLYLMDGDLMMVETVANNNLILDSIALVDTSTNETYVVYVIDAKLMMEKTTNVYESILDDIQLTDRLTNKTYNLYVMDGELMMKESEE